MPAGFHPQAIVGKNPSQDVRPVQDAPGASSRTESIQPPPDLAARLQKLDAQLHRHDPRFAEPRRPTTETAQAVPSLDDKLEGVMREGRRKTRGTGEVVIDAGQRADAATTGLAATVGPGGGQPQLDASPEELTDLLRDLRQLARRDPKQAQDLLQRFPAFAKRLNAAVSAQAPVRQSLAWL